MAFRQKCEQDPELGLPQVPQIGFPALGEWIAEDPDNESFIFRKFQRLSARNLLYLQSKVHMLEAESRKLDKQLLEADAHLRLSMMRFETWTEKAKDEGSPEAERIRLAEKLKAALQEYYEALMLFSNIVHLSSPRKYQVDLFKDWFSGKSSGTTRTFNVVAGHSKTMLDDGDDLVSLRSPLEQDFLTQKLQRYWTRLTPFTTGGSRTHSTTRYYYRRRLMRVISIISTVIVILEIVAPIVSLYFVRNPGSRLGMISGFTIMFGLSLCFLTSARRGEIFAATAAYAAVMVVFVSGDLGQKA